MTGDGSGHAAWKPPAPTTSPPTTESLTGYSDLHQIGVGGDSVVYRATEDTLGRDVAIKVLNVDDEARAARFAREVEITLDLGRQHPNIVTVLATGITGSGRPAIVMEFYPGGTLHDRLKEFGPLPVDEVVRIGLVLADALSFAHDRGVLHRDVKPQNVLVLPTSWVLADFGIARLVDSEHTSSVETFTYRHASPQVLDGHAPTAADDIWSLGSTLYTLVDGRPPFASDDPDDDSALAYLRRARIEPHRPLAVPGTEALAAVIDRCLVKDVEGRWSSAGELHDALLGLRHRAWEPGGARGVRTRPDAGARRPEPRPPARVSTPATPGRRQHRAPPRARRGHPTARSPPHRPRLAPDRRLGPPARAGRAVGRGARARRDARRRRADRHGAARRAPRAGPAAPTLEPAAPAPTRRRRLVIGLGVLALLIGTALGVTGAVLRDDDPAETPAADDGNAGQQIPELTEKPVETDPKPTSLDPALAFEFVGLTYQGGNLVASWQDPSDGEAFFHISQTKPEQAFSEVFDVGQTEAEFPYQLGLGRTCFVSWSRTCPTSRWACPTSAA